MAEAADLVVRDLDAPVEEPLVRGGTIERTVTEVERGLALALSGGGYRAMLFHVGALWRLKELKLLGSLKRISSVSGGSITAGVVAIHWNRINPESPEMDQYVSEVVAPLRELASDTIDVNAVGWGVINPFRSVGDEVAAYYRDYLFGSKTLQDLPEGNTRFVFTATSVQTGSLWRFSRPYMGDYRVGLFENPKVDIATAVAASSAFPPFLSPVTLDLAAETLKPGTAGELFKPPYNEVVVLTDGGVYDNLGLEPIWKRYDTILASDGGRSLAFDGDPADDWARHSRRLIDLLQGQVSRLRRRQLMESFRRGRHTRPDERNSLLEREGRWGVYFGIQTNINNYDVVDALPAPFERTSEIALIDTRLAALEDEVQEQLINWGYAVSDAAVRSAGLGLEPGFRAPKFPYPRGID
jgi:NTE family protein